MKCPQCKQKVPKDVDRCPGCGAEIVKKSHLRKFIVLGVVLALLVAGVILITSLDNPVDACMDAFLNNRFEEATAIYQRDIEKSSRRVNEITPLIQQRLEELVSAYRTDETRYEEIKTILSDMQGFPLLNNQIQQALYFVESLHSSRAAYTEAQTLYGEGYYALAILELQKMIPEDENYQQAQKDVADYQEKQNQYEAEAVAAAEQQLAAVTDALIVTPDEESAGPVLRIVCKNQDPERTIQAVTFAYTLTDEKDANMKFVDGVGPVYFNSRECVLEPEDSCGDDMDIPLNKDVTGAYPLKAKGCVVKATFSDGSVWENPYYSYWLKDSLTREEYKSYQESQQKDHGDGGATGTPAPTPSPSPAP